LQYDISSPDSYDKYGLELGIAVGASEKSASISYDIPAISQHLTFINVMTYDFHMALDGYLGLNAPLSEVTESIDYWLSHGKLGNRKNSDIPVIIVYYG